MYPFVQARYFTPGGLRECRALVIHMAEGAGTVSWLTHPSGDNSADYVVELSGRIVQMVRDDDYSHSLHWDTAHQSVSDCNGTFSPAKAAALLGISASTFPLPYMKAVEVEGYAKDGPNAAQMDALEHDLIPHVRARWPSCRGLLGHRDFMGYKACPGCHVFDRLHHGPWPTEVPDMRSFTFDGTAGLGSLKVTTEGHKWLRLADSTLHGPVAVGWAKDHAFGPVKLTEPIPGGLPGADRSTGYVVGLEAAFLLASDVVFTPASKGDCTAAILAARVHDRDAAIAAIQGVYP